MFYLYNQEVFLEYQVAKMEIVVITSIIFIQMNRYQYRLNRVYLVFRLKRFLLAVYFHNLSVFVVI